MNETYTTVTGNLIGAVNRRRLPDGTSVANFRVASNERKWKPSSGQWGDGARLFVSVTCWRRLADNVLASFVAGDPIIVHGRLYSRDYEKDGTRHWVTEMEGVAVGPDLTRCTASVTRTPRPAPGEPAPGAGGGGPQPDPVPVEVGVGA